MAEIVNLRAKRKDVARKQARVIADANTARFGRTKAERLAEKALLQKSARDLEGHKRDPD